MQSINLKINTKEVMNASERTIAKALEAIGQQVVSNAKTEIDNGDHPRTDTGTLKNSLTHQVKAEEKAVYVGTNLEYAPYVEFGTGYYYDKNGKEKTGDPPKNAQIWWVYVKGGDTSNKNTGSAKRYTYAEAARIVAILRSKTDASGKQIQAFMTAGMKPKHFLKNAIQNNVDQYKGIAEKFLSENMK